MKISGFPPSEGDLYKFRSSGILKTVTFELEFLKIWFYQSMLGPVIVGWHFHYVKKFLNVT